MKYAYIIFLPVIILASLCSIQASAGTLPELDINLLTISDPGNLAYPGGQYGMRAGRGSVAYEFRIAQTEITTDQWLNFYNTFSTQSDEMAALLVPVGWGARPDSQYQGPGNRFELSEAFHHPGLTPVGVTWRQAAMFCNWMHNGQISDPNSITHGAYDTSTFTRNADLSYNDQSTHNPDAKYWIPTLDEYLKAAHYDPNKNGQGPGWWEYGHSSDTPPVWGVPGEGDVARDLTDEQLIEFVGIPSTLFPLGFYDDVQSPWGLLDLLGGFGEFTEEWEYEDFHSRRLFNSSSNLTTYDGIVDEAWHFDPRSPIWRGGLRIAAAIPSPSTIVVLGVSSLFFTRRRG